MSKLMTYAEAAGNILEQTPEKAVAKAPARPSMLKDLLFLVIKISCIAMVFVLLFTFLFGIIRYQEPSMSPAIKDGDLVLFYRYNQKGFQARDVVAFEYNGKTIVRRVIATAGDSVDINENGLMINGAIQQELEIMHWTERYEEGVDFPLKVPEGHIFVLSDYRLNASDSRIFGTVEIEDTFGKVMAVIRRRGI